MGQKIITIAAIVFALVFVLILAVMMGTITNKANTANTQLADTLNMTANTGVDQYNNVVLKGESVISAIKNVKTIGGDLKLKVTVKTGMNTSGQSYGYLDDGSFAEYKPLPSSDNNYISPSSEFQSEVVNNANDIATEIVFTQKGVN